VTDQAYTQTAPTSEKASVSQPGALSGFRILDATRLLPGAFCSQILADMGAEVIKIEEPGKGDYNRTFPPLYKGESGSFLLLNRNKKSISLNLKSAEGKEIFKKLVATADVVIEGFRPGVMERLGLSYETLKEINPGIIFCSISGYGQDGPYRLTPGHDLNYLAIAGALRLFAADGHPIVPGLSVADVGGGSLMAVSGILAALLSRHASSKGQAIDISMTDGTVSWLALHGADYLFAGKELNGGELPLVGQAPCYNVYQCNDGKHVALGTIEPHFWSRFCEAVDMPELIEDQWPIGEGAARQAERLRSLFLERTQEEWVAFLAPADIPFSPVKTMEEAMRDPQLKHRKMFFQMEHPTAGTIPQLGFPIKLSETPCTSYAPPPALGEHNEEVLRLVGYSGADLERLKESHVV